MTIVSAVRGIDIKHSWNYEGAIKLTDPPSSETLGDYTADVRGNIFRRGETGDGAKLPVLVGVPVAVWRKRSRDDKDHREGREDEDMDNAKEVDFENAVDDNIAGSSADNEWELGYFAWVLQRDKSEKATYRRVGSIERSNLEDIQWLLGGVKERLVVL